jgi:aminoglycoside phosphotransferase (APT) family kinase protein
VFHGAPHGAERLAAFYREIGSGRRPSFALPEIIEQGEAGGVFYSLDRLIPGRSLHELLILLQGDDRRRALASYADAVFEIVDLPCTVDAYGEFLRDDDSIQAKTWGAYLLARMQRSLSEAPWLSNDLQALDAIVEELSARIARLRSQKKLVHGDYFPGNVMIGDDLRVSGVIDFGPLTVIGDPQLDIASALMFLEVSRPGYRVEDTAFVRERLIERAGNDLDEYVRTYSGWYAIRFSPYRDDDANLYAWCVRTLRRIADGEA